MPLNTASVSSQEEGFTEQGDLNNPYSNSDWYKSCPFSHCWDSQGQNGHLPLLLSLGRTPLTWVSMKCVIVGCPAYFFLEHRKNETCLECHRSKWLSARLWDVYRQHQYSAVDFRDIQNLTAQVPEQPDVTGPALGRCWTKQPPRVPPNLHDFTTGPCYIRFWVPSPLASISEWSPPALMDASLREEPGGDLNAPAMCEWGYFMPEVLTPWHEWNRHQFDDVANAEKKKIKILLLFLVAYFIFYSEFDSCTLVSTSSRKWAITPN